MKISRLKSKSLVAAIQHYDNRDVLLVQGARQVGKTTLVQECLRAFPGALELNLEKDQHSLRAIDRTQSFDEFTRWLQSRFQKALFDDPNTILFIDEAQESTRLGSYVRSMKEDWRNARVILSGSSMSRIFRNTDRVPVGRYRPWLVTPLVFGEFLSVWPGSHLGALASDFQGNPREGLIEDALHNEFLSVVDEYLTVGGLPEVVTTYFQDGDFRSKRQAIFDAQEDDFVRKSSLADRALFSRGLRGVANFIGMPSKYSHIHETKSVAARILSEQAAWNLILEVEQKGLSSTTQMLPKRYMYDIGMAQDVRDMPFPRLSVASTTNPNLRAQLGGIFENALLTQVLDEQTHAGNITGWRMGGTDSSEVDFIWRSGLGAIPIECKATLKISQKHWTSVKAYLDATDQTVGILVTAAPFKITRTGKRILINLPIYLATLENIAACVRRYS